MRLSRRGLLAMGGALMTTRAVAGDAPSENRPKLAPDELGKLLAQIAAARAGLRTLVGPFTQERSIGLLAATVRSTGKLTLVRPDRLRWELFPPDEIVYWVTPEGLSYKSRAGQGSVRGTANQRIAAALADVRTLLAGDLGGLRARYDLAAFARADASREVEIEATLRPGALSLGLDRLAFAIAPDLVRPTRAMLVESKRDRTEITFGALTRDAAVEPAAMRGPT